MKNCPPLRWSIAAGCAAGGSLALALVAGCGRTTAVATDSQPDGGKGANSAGVPRVETMLVEQRELVETVEMPGTVEGFESADLYAKTGGYLQEMYVDIGDEVSQGQALAQIYVPEMKKELAQKEAALLQAEAKIEQSEAIIEKVKADAASFQAALDEAQTELAENDRNSQEISQ